MKVILKGIRPYDPKIDGEFDDTLIFYRSLLEQVPYPLEREAEDQYPHTINLDRYIKDKDYPNNSQNWGLIWFDYEEVKD